MHSQLSPHLARPVAIPSRFGPIAGLRGAGEGPLVLMVPGYTGSKEDFAPVLDGIVAAGFTPLAIDLPGQQDSAGPADEHLYLPERLGEVLAEVIAELPPPVLLVGHSFGGLVARRAVLAGAEIAGLTLLDSGPADLPPGPRRQILDLGEPLLREHGVPAVQRGLDAVNAGNPRWQAMSEPVRAFLRGRFLRNRPEALLGMSIGLRTEPDLVTELGRQLRLTSTPCLVACGALDDAWPTSVQRDMADRLAADFSMIEGAAHSPAVENPAGLLSVLVPTWQSWLS
ncbi:alpha/beta hydrolase [Actinokineospora sp. NBRC 105648]|uniref:alpha/beta fold hydrolase n=1 Tax=Actinokineospora sp. NBRC 105648 TaxID=3032206 RepID=UPI0024A33192|nr:alpha/beta hydrolase [Actinokineospora sp. NBRC 105648]GLZ43556.1 alpha/beta hydrolase [Actinokineospora sp. NBRC 105648]